MDYKPIAKLKLQKFQKKTQGKKNLCDFGLGKDFVEQRENG